MKLLRKSIFKIKYPKFFLLVLSFITAYYLFDSAYFDPIRNIIMKLGYFGTFFFGIIFVQGFTAAPATAALLLIAKEQNMYLAGIIAGLGALVGDLIIFKFIKYSFADEIKKFRREKLVKEISGITPGPIKKYLVPVLGGFIIASPLPDEIGVSLFAMSKHASVKIFSIISFSLNTAGILIILYIGKSI